MTPIIYSGLINKLILVLLIILSIMSVSPFFTLMCIPCDGIPFEATGLYSKNACTMGKLATAAAGAPASRDRLIIRLVKREFGVDLCQPSGTSLQISIKTEIKNDNTVWNHIEDIINHSQARIFIQLSKNENKSVITKHGNRLRGDIYIWIDTKYYEVYDTNLEKKSAWAFAQPCRCYKCLEPNLSWSMANL